MNKCREGGGIRSLSIRLCFARELPLRVRNYYLLATRYTVARSLTGVYIGAREREFESEVERALRRVIKAFRRAGGV